jgi:hypothetical protein
MAVSKAPIFSNAGSIQGLAAALLVANTAVDGTGTLNTVFTAPADGAFVQYIKATPLGTTGGATVLRLFNFDGAVNRLWKEMTIPAVVISQVAALPEFVMPLNVALKGGDILKVTIGTTITAGLMVVGVGGSFQALP